VIMADDDKRQDDNGGLHLRVDRLAAAMETARARARANAAGASAPDTTAARRPAVSVPSGGGDAAPPDGSSPPVAPGQAASAWTRTAVPEAAPHGAGHGRPAAPGYMGLDPEAPVAVPGADHDARRSEPVRDPHAAVPPSPPSDAAMAAPAPLLLTQAYHPPDPESAPADDHSGPRDADTGDAAPATIVVPATPAMPSPAPQPVRAAALLALSQVATDIGRYRILGDVTLDVPRGAVTMLLGRNGAGKTTTLRTIMGLWRARAGEIVFAGDRIDRWATHRIARAGIGYVPESMSIFADLTVAENIALGARAGAPGRDRLDWLTGLFPPLGTFWRSPAGNLSGGQKQMLALARALVEKRRLYLIDEPTKGLAPVIVDTVVAALRDLKLQGATILMVEQNFAVARALGDACAVLEDGRMAWSGSMAALADDPALQARLMGLDLGGAA